MGYSNWSNHAFTNLTAARSKASKQQIFTTQGKVDPSMNPHNLGHRESRDSAAHPDSNAIIVGFDVTGSMGKIPEQFAREKLGGLMRLIVENDYIADPQILFAAIGDTYSDRGPLQVGQFESGLEMDMWLTRMWLEGNGGGQSRESYTAAHWFASQHTRTDCWEKRQKKGYLFTIGDEMTWGLPKAHIAKLFGDNAERDYSPEELIAEAQKTWNVFHVHVADGYNGGNLQFREHWRELLGERALVLLDSGGICELIGTTIGVCEGRLDILTARQNLARSGTSAATADAILAALAPVASTALVPTAVGSIVATTTTRRGTERL